LRANSILRLFIAKWNHPIELFNLVDFLKMASLFASRRKPRRVGREPEPAASAEDEEEGKPAIVHSIRTSL
jgi:hypothetical protein